ncbi:MAG TPA: hypothetical protein DCW52_05855 [Gammaproteobacteria bacterium]|jgi:hypothetical protein|nr:hypothetical protein [Gammaproteobacteria bacterium]
MKKTLLNWTSRAVAVVAIGLVSTIVSAQSASGQSVDQVFARELKLVEGLKVYNDQLNAQLRAQGVARAEILKSIEDSKGLEEQVAPLLSTMLSALDKFVQADLPFHQEDRMDSIGRLKALMSNPEARTSDRFRNIMDIYTSEIEYGNTFEAYRGSIPVDGEDTVLDILRIGRLSLYAQTDDRKRSFMWDKASGQWVDIDSHRDIRTAIKVASKTVAPELLSLPVSAPEGT